MDGLGQPGSIDGIRADGPEEAHRAALTMPKKTRSRTMTSRPEWWLIQIKTGELHFVPANEPHEYDDSCWCLLDWDDYIERLGAGAYWHKPIAKRASSRRLPE